MSAVHFVSATAPSDQCRAAKAAKLLTSTLARTCGDEVQRIANWQCMEHGLEGAIVMRFIDTNAVTKATEWVIRHTKDYTALKNQGPPPDAWLGGEKAEKALRKANALEALFLGHTVPGLSDLSWVSEDDELVEQDEEFKAVVTNAGDMSSDGGVIRIIVVDGGVEIDGKEMAITSVIMPYTAEEL